MTLTLSMLRCPDGVAPETRRVAGGELSIGRGPQSDWVLPDPERVLSKRHCIVTFQDQTWQVRDMSANGTFLNHTVDRLEPEAPRVLRNGDRLLLGSYEIEAAIDRGGEARLAGAKPTPDVTDERLIGDPFPALETDPLGIAMSPVGLPAAFKGTTPDDVPAVAGNFRPPRPSLELIPDDWDADLPDSTPPVEAPEAAPSVAPLVEPQAVPAGTGAEGFAAFTAGAGIDAPSPADPLAVLNGLGRAFRAVVHGLRGTMIVRAAVKGEFRIAQTVIQESGNNPLKFSAGDDDALAALIGPGRHGYVNAERAIDEAMRDMRLHELAVATAMQQAVRDMLARLSPEQVARRADKAALDFLPGQGAARRWDAYQALHRETVEALSENFDSVFGASFMRAYERAMRELAEQREEPMASPAWAPEIPRRAL